MIWKEDSVEYKVQLPSMKDERVFDSRRSLFLVAASSGFSAGLSCAAVFYSVLSHTTASRFVFGMVGVIAIGQLVNLVREHRRMKRIREELDVEIERSIAAFKARMEGDGLDPITVAGVILKLRADLKEMMP